MWGSTAILLDWPTPEPLNYYLAFCSNLEMNRAYWQIVTFHITLYLKLPDAACCIDLGSHSRSDVTNDMHATNFGMWSDVLVLATSAVGSVSLVSSMLTSLASTAACVSCSTPPCTEWWCLWWDWDITQSVRLQIRQQSRHRQSSFISAVFSQESVLWSNGPTSAGSCWWRDWGSASQQWWSPTWIRPVLLARPLWAWFGRAALNS